MAKRFRFEFPCTKSFRAWQFFPWISHWRKPPELRVDTWNFERREIFPTKIDACCHWYTCWDKLRKQARGSLLTPLLAFNYVVILWMIIVYCTGQRKHECTLNCWYIAVRDGDKLFPKHFSNVVNCSTSLCNYDPSDFCQITGFWYVHSSQTTNILAVFIWRPWSFNVLIARMLSRSEELLFCLIGLSGNIPHYWSFSAFGLIFLKSFNFYNLVLFLTKEAYSHGGLQTRKLGQTPWSGFSMVPIGCCEFFGYSRRHGLSFKNVLNRNCDIKSELILLPQK